MSRLVKTACSAFIYGDLLRAALELMAGAQGSFGLVLSHSLDAEKDVVIASRGQTMSVAFYPSLGCVAFGSEAAATKVWHQGVRRSWHSQRRSSGSCSLPSPLTLLP